MSTANEQKVFFPNLDGLRYVAFFAVFVQHALGLGLEPHFPKSYVMNKLTNFLIWSGGSGVSLFFVLSGFLITYLLLKEYEKNGRIDVGAFYVRRTLRIWPLYFALVLFGLFVYAPLEGFYQQLNSEKWKYLFFAGNFACLQPGGNIHPISITWSVAVEEQFYLVWPLLFAFTPRKWWLFICPLVMLLSLGFRIMHYDEAITVLYFNSFALIYDMALGGLCAYLSLNNKGFKSFFEQLKNKYRLLIYITGFLILIFGTRILPETGYYVYLRLCSTALFAFIICDQCFNLSTVAKFGNAAFLTRWGKYTYGMYLLHPVVQEYTARVAKPILYQVSEVPLLFVNALLALVATHAVCYLSYKYFESPFLKLKKKFSYISRD